MAPDVARESLSHLPVGARVIDPMCGSGSVLRACVEGDLDCAGLDIDPLAVLMASVWTRSLDVNDLTDRAAEAVNTAKALAGSDVKLPDDAETMRFIDYWFASSQQDQLARLAVAVGREEDASMRDALRIALSRIIVTKERGASMARDVSHSRPHRVWFDGSFDVYAAFTRSARQLVSRLAPEAIKGTARVALGDARNLAGLDDRSFDAAVTSPPYLNAIDYLRGHRMTLAWLGHDISDLRAIRSSSIGAERQLVDVAIDVDQFISRSDTSTLTDGQVGWVRRYADDMGSVLKELRRVVKPGGRVTVVVGNSVIRGASVDNAGIIENLADTLDLTRVRRADRDIPSRRRYLPPPKDGGGLLDARMRQETVLTFECS